MEKMSPVRYEDRIALMVRGLPKGYVPRHFKLAAEVLGRLAKELDRQGFKFQEDPYWPYHLLVARSKDRYASFFCGGFRQGIEIQELKRDGTADTRFKEESFSTPKGAVNYLRRKSKER